VSHDNWRELAERASKEQDPETLMAIVEELTGIKSASAGFPCAKMVCFFGKSMAFLPSPMVASSALGSNSRLFLATAL